MANNRKRNSKGFNIFKIVLTMLKETCTFLFDVAIGCLNLVEAIFE